MNPIDDIARMRRQIDDHPKPTDKTSAPRQNGSQ